MATKKIIKEAVENKTTKKTSKKEKPYDNEFKIEKVKLFVIIVGRNQSDYYLNEFKKTEIACSFVVYGRGTATKDIYEVLGIGETKKDIIFALVKESDIDKLKEIIAYRFNASKAAKGIAFSIPFDSMAGVLMYRYLTNTKTNVVKTKEVNENGTK